MQAEDRDTGYLWDMLDAARAIRDFNLLAHEYGEISQDRIWLVAARRIPELIGQLDSMLPPAPPHKSA